MISLSTIYFLIFLLIVFICLYKYFKVKGIGHEAYLKLMNIDKELKKQIEDYIAKKTTVNFKFISLNKGNKYDKIKCEWLNEAFSISNNKIYSCEIKNKDGEKETNSIEAIRKQKIILIKNNEKKEFNLDIYLHQENNFYVITDIQEGNTYSLDVVYYAKNKNLTPKKLEFNGNDLFLDDYNIDNMRRNCLINMEQQSCIKFINTISNLEIKEDDKIFQNKENNLFLNIRIIKKDILSCSLFLEQKINKVYYLSKEELNALDDFNEKIIQNIIMKYKDYKLKDITPEMEDNFLKSQNQFSLKIFQKGINKYSKKDNENLDDEPISLINDNVYEKVADEEEEEEGELREEDKEKGEDKINEEEEEEDIMNDIAERKVEKDEKKKEINLNLKKLKHQKPKSLIYLENLLDNFFASSIEERYINPPSQEDLETIEKMCYLCLSLTSTQPLASVISFYQNKTKILNEVKNFSIKDKIKIICSIESLVNLFLYAKIKLYRMEDLPEYSPYICGEVLYRNIIKCLTEKSKLNFIFIQLNSGCGFDYIKNGSCYFLKMIPLVVIKSHLLNIYDKYFFTFSSSIATEFAFTDSYTGIVSINEKKVFGSENIAYKKNKDNSIKVCLLNIHEKGGHKKFGKLELSPRYLVSEELNLLDNYLERTKAGESGVALELILFGEINIIATLIMCCKNLQKLSDYNLFAEEFGKYNLIKEIKKIFRNNEIKLENMKNIKAMNSSSIDFDARIIKYLKTYRIHNFKRIKKNK